MDDESIMQTVHSLVEEEHRLRTLVQTGAIPAAEEQERLRHLEESLDQCWDLLRQRRARRESGQNPDVAAPREVREVEGYLQ